MARMLVTGSGRTTSRDRGPAGCQALETLREYDYGVTAICGGLCSCATCHIFIDPEWMPRLPAAAGRREGTAGRTPATTTRPDRRLSCQLDFTEALDGLALAVPPDE